MNIENELNDVIIDDLTKLKEKEVGSDEYKATVDSLSKLMDRAIEIEKINVEESVKKEQLEKEAELKKLQIESEEKLKMKQLESDANLKQQQMTDEKRHKIVDTCVAVGSILIPVAVTIWGTKKSFEFEREGTITTIMGRGFISKLLPKK